MNNITKHILLLLCISVCAVSCYTDIDGSVYNSDVESVLYVSSVMTTDEHPVVTVKSAVPAFGDEEPEVFTGNHVEVSLIVDNSAEFQLVYDEKAEGFTTKDVIGTELSNYQVTIDPIFDTPINAVYSETDILLKDNLDGMELIDNKSYQLPNTGNGLFPFRYIYDVSFTMPGELKGDYYMLLPVGRIIGQDLDVRTYTNDFDTYTINSVVEKPNDFDVIMDGNGLLMDFSNGETTRTLQMNISLDENRVKTLFLQRHIYFSLQNITKDYYMYLKSGGGVATYNGTSFVEPIIEYTNIEDGLGIYGGAAVTLDSLLITN